MNLPIYLKTNIYLFTWKFTEFLLIIPPLGLFGSFSVNGLLISTSCPSSSISDWLLPLPSLCSSSSRGGGSLGLGGLPLFKLSLACSIVGREEDFNHGLEGKLKVSSIQWNYKCKHIRWTYQTSEITEMQVGYKCFS